MKREKGSVQTTISRFTSRVVSLAKKATGDRSEPAVARGEGGFADWVIVTIHALHEFRSTSYRALLDELSQMDEVIGKLDLETDKLPDFTTVCARYQDLKMAVWRSLLRHSANLIQTGSVQAIDATGFDRRGASQHYANWANYTFEAVKTTAVVDCKTSVILDIHCSMKQPHDTQIGPQVLERNLEQVEILAADKGYDSAEFRENLRKEGVIPVIEHREFSALDRAHNARQDDEI